MSRSVQTPSKAFAFPNEWQPVRLGSIGKTYGGLTGKSGDDFNTGSASYVTFMQVMGNSRLREPAKGTVNINPGERQNHVQKDDLLFNGSSETPEEVALAAAVDFHPDSDTFLNSFCFGFRLLPDAPADSLFLAYLFRSSVGRNLVSSLAQGATRYNISKTQLLNQEIHLPPKAEQIAIREKLTDAEELINSLERLISKKQAIKQGIMQELLSGRNRLPGFVEPWARRNFSEITHRVATKKFQIPASSYLRSGLIPVVDQGKRKIIGYTNNVERAFRPGASGVIVFGDHTCISKFVDFPFVVGADGTQIIRASLGMSARFLSYVLQFDPVESTGYNRHLKFLLEKEIFFPTLEEQESIASILRDVDREIDTLGIHLVVAQNIKQGMMQELLTGRTRLPVEEVSS